MCGLHSTGEPRLVRVVPEYLLHDGLRLLAVRGVGGALTQRDKLHLQAAELRERRPASLAGPELFLFALVDVHDVVGDACSG